MLRSEPNEAGKSALFDALRALHRSTKADARALQSRSGGTVVVGLEAEHEGFRWRIRKQWL
ncbi:hypothetical protein [Palleronia rufa]|uniref:hypothetical protein n=1 Tax=Palleronia rufa TaxID=1530186 RepID=UPI000561D8F3|nr:hypothetical protein [Palleronia rufa]